MFKKIAICLVVFSSWVGFTYACTGNDCKTTGNVMTSNDGNKGYIFTYDCNQGQTNVGKWVDSSFLKGEKGDTGTTGATGSQGEQGVQGFAGKDGLNGTNGINGVDGKDGQDGTKGDIGLQGEQGVQGDIGASGEVGAKGDTGSKGDTGAEGKEGKKGEQGIQGEQGKGLDDRVELIGEIRVLDTRKTTWSIYAGKDFNNKVGIVGAKFTYKLGTSYEERRINELESKLRIIQPSINENVSVMPTATGFKIQVNK